MNSGYGNAFKDVLRLRFTAQSDKSIPSEWIAQHTRLKNRRYSFDEHEYQLQFVNDHHRIVTAKKCAQIGFTEILLRRVIHFLVTHQGSQAIFTQPTDGDASKFSKSRIDTVFEDTEIIQQLNSGFDVSSLKKIDSAFLKRVGSSFLNLKGTFGSKAAISVPSDMNIYDEVNFSNPRVLSQYKSRLQHSKFKFERAISTPTIPEYGVSTLYDNSDQKRVVIRCCHCGYAQFMEWETHVWLKYTGSASAIPQLMDPDVMDKYVEESWNWRPLICCIKCERELDRSWQGGKREWVAAYPERAQDLDNGISGYQIGQLDVTFVDPADIVKASDPRFPEGYKREEDFYNFVLGRDKAGGEGMKITEAVKQSATINMSFGDTTFGTFFGLDLGKTCHFVAIKDIYLNGRLTPVIIEALEIPSNDIEDVLPTIGKRLGMLYGVSDAMPYTTTVTKVGKKPGFAGRFKICYFGGKKEFSTSDDAIEVTANKTLTLDRVTDGLSTSELLVASGIQNYDLFWKHCEKLVKQKVEDDDGEVFFEYVKIGKGEDHFGYAAAYAMLARLMFQNSNLAGAANQAPVEITGHRTSL